MVFTDEDKLLGTRPIKFDKHYGNKCLQKTFPNKNWSLRGLN